MIKTVRRYKGSLHGFKAKEFHKRCDNLGKPTVSLFNTTNGISIAGYTSADWSSSEDGSYEADHTARLFNLTKQRTFDCQDYSHAIWCKNDSGPYFGYG